jgi:hypothetical protein
MAEIKPEVKPAVVEAVPEVDAILSSCVAKYTTEIDEARETLLKATGKALEMAKIEPLTKTKDGKSFPNPIYNRIMSQSKAFAVDYFNGRFK